MKDCGIVGRGERGREETERDYFYKYTTTKL